MRRLDVLQPLLAHRAALLPGLPEPARQELRDREAALRTGAHAALLIELGQGVAPPLRPVQVGSGRATEMRALFEEIFGHPMSEAHWRWKYATGLGHAVGLLDAEGSLVAHYGGLTRPARVFGERVMACQVCDVMVSPRARRSLARRGPMFNLAASFLEEQIGWGLRHEIGFGFPSARHHGAADRLGLYEAVDRVVELSWPARGHSVNAHVRPVALQNGRLMVKAVARIESLWREMAKDMGESALGERDAAWVQWRYLDRPEVEYELHWVLSPWIFRPLGLLVLRRREDALELMDLIAPKPAFGRLVQAARQMAHVAGLPVVRMWITASHRELFAVADPQTPANERELNIDVPACAHTLGPEPARFRGRWFLMAGDADFT
ncbi:GNAT family N-acetyltransferase [Inhella proteolytica]|nr:GNAT family N-acetyltransferase [Inhella proteolytica]